MAIPFDLLFKRLVCLVAKLQSQLIPSTVGTTTAAPGGDDITP
jgi:hypothetical protein